MRGVNKQHTHACMLNEAVRTDDGLPVLRRHVCVEAVALGLLVLGKDAVEVVHLVAHDDVREHLV